MDFVTVMTSLKKLSGVAHDIAHHAQSSLSWLHPHMGEACHIAGVTSAHLDLLTENPYPFGLPKFKPLELALLGLQDKFGQIMESAAVPLSAVKVVRLAFTFPAPDNYFCTVFAAITATDGHVFKQTVV